MKQFGKTNGEVICFFSHGTNHSRGVRILLHPTMTFQMEYSFRNNTGRIVLITILLNSMKLSLFNIYAPNNQTDQSEFLQELDNCIMDKSELSSLIVGGDWNCALTNEDKMGGTTWKPTVYGNLILATGRFRLRRYSKVTAPKVEKIYIQIKSPKGKIQNRLFLSGKKPDSICEEE